MAALTYAQVKSSVLAEMKERPNMWPVLIYKDFEGNHKFIELDPRIIENVCYIQLKALIVNTKPFPDVITDRAGIQRGLKNCRLKLVYGAF